MCRLSSKAQLDVLVSPARPFKAESPKLSGANVDEAARVNPIIDEFYLSRIPGDYDCDTHLPLSKIKTLFKVKWGEDHPEVKFQIMEKR